MRKRLIISVLSIIILLIISSSALLLQNSSNNDFEQDMNLELYNRIKDSHHIAISEIMEVIIERTDEYISSHSRSRVLFLNAPDDINKMRQIVEMIKDTEEEIKVFEHEGMRLDAKMPIRIGFHIEDEDGSLSAIPTHYNIDENKLAFYESDFIDPHPEKGYTVEQWERLMKRRYFVIEPLPEFKDLIQTLLEERACEGK